MAKRKSLNRRSSRYSSTILNSNSDISSDEYTSTDWWKNLEDNTIRPSTASNILNQTSRQLDSNSQIKTSQVTDGWWKALEVTNISNSSKVNENIITKESSNNVLTSESEEESKIVRRKYFLRSKIRTSKDNIFLDALNNSITTSELTQKTGKESSINKSALSNKTDLNAEQSNEMQAIKKLSTKSRKAKKSRNLSSWHSTIPEYETESLSWSLLSLDTKSIDTFTTYVADNSEDSVSMCCYCDEYEENQRNENIENEMMI